MIKFPYGRRDFFEIITEEYLYLDRTHYIPFMEDWGKELLFMRPRRFGKSLWLSTLMNYYDMKKEADFERLFGHLSIGQEPTPLRNSYMVMRWDFSRVASYGTVEQIQSSLSDHINSRARIFQREYDEFLRFPIDINPANALDTFDSLVNTVRLSGYQLFLFIDEYDNFANEIMMASSHLMDEPSASNAQNQDRYRNLVQGEGIFKTFFKNLKSAGSGDGLARIFMTGVSPIVLNDVTSGANIFEDISWHPKVNELCGFTEDEIAQLVEQVVESCELPNADVEQILDLLEHYYNGSCFIDQYNLEKSTDSEIAKVYNPTLTLYFLKELQWRCDYPRQMIDQNLVPDESKLAYIAAFDEGRDLLERALSVDKPITVETVQRKFGVTDFFNPNLQQDALAVLLCYLGGLTTVGDRPDNSIVLEIPNLVMRKLYTERILAQMVNEDDAKIAAGKQATSQLFIDGNIEPLCTFVSENLLPVYDTRDARHFNELTVKTLFITLLYNNQIYLMDSEPELEQQYGDLLMLVRPGMKQRGLSNILIEFKYLPLSKITKEENGKRQRMDGQAVKRASNAELMMISSIQEQFDDAKSQLQTYRQTLQKKYNSGADQGTFKLRTFAVVSIGMKRILWEELK